MIKIMRFLVLFICFPQTIYAQNKSLNIYTDSIPEANCASVDKLSLYIRQNYLTDTARIRAIYLWVTNHISYDVARMEAVKNNPLGEAQTIADVLKERRAVCQGYANLFTALCKNVGINALVVPGYVKNMGKILPLSHAWVAAELDGDWFIFDPTWGSGYLANGQFVKHFNNTFYKQNPKDIVVDHMPFDPLYQFLSYPINNRNFIDGTPTNNKVLFNYKDSLTTYNQLSSPLQIAAELRRVEGAGIENDLLQQRRQYLQKALQSYKANNAFVDAGHTFSRAVVLLNKYFEQKNKQFTTIGDNDLVQAVDSMKYYIVFSRSLMAESVSQNDEQQRAKTNNLANMDQYWKQLDQEDQFVKKYISADKESRKMMFMKR